MARGHNNKQQLVQSDDSSSPFFLQSGDTPGLILVSEPLIGCNYQTWSRSVLVALKARNKVPFIDGSIEQPEVGDLLFGAWERCNSMVIAWLSKVVSSEIASSLLYLETAKEVWDDLHIRFSQGNDPQIFELKLQLMMLKQGSLDVNGYFTKFCIIWDELRDYQPGACEKCHEYQQKDCVMSFLVGLNESYSQIRSQVLSMNPFPFITKVFSIVVQEERQRLIGNSNFGTYNPIVSEQTSVNLTQVQQNFGKTQNQHQRDKDKPICSHCGKPNHTVETCYKIHGYPSGYGRGRNNGKFEGPKGRANSTTTSNSIGQFISATNSVDAVNSALSQQQYQQLVAMLSTKFQPLAVATPSIPPSSIMHENPSASSFSGSFSGEADWDG